MPPEARTIIVDDDEDTIKDLSKYLNARGHVVLGTATTFNDGYNLVKELANNIEVGLFDGNIDPMTVQGKDGKILASALRNRNPNAKVISISSTSQPWSDRQDLTYASGLKAIVDAVTKI